MGSKKKRRDSDSSSSSSDSDSSESSAENRSKRQSKKNRERKEEVDKEDNNKDRKRRRSPSPPSKEAPKKNERKQLRYDRGKHEERRSRPDSYNNRSHDDRYRNRRPDYKERRDDRDHRDQRVDRERDYRDQRNERNHRGRREDNRDHFNRDRNRRRSRSSSFDHKNARWGKGDDKKPDEKESKEKLKPNFALSGKLTEERNTYRGVVIKYSEPPEARKPKRRWRLYPFKGDKALQTLYIHRESAYLIGRDRKVVDLAVDHPSCSKQHAVLQYRLVPFTREDGSAGKRVRPYLIDLNSANGTHINNKKIEPSKYIELLEKDVIKFGYSSREYVLLHENSKDEAQDDDVKPEDEVVVKKEED